MKLLKKSSKKRQSDNTTMNKNHESKRDEYVKECQKKNPFK
jgi:hypothetical protein